MKLQRRRPDEPPIEIRVTVPAETVSQLKAYCRYYEVTYGEPIEVSAVTVAILQHFLEVDRDFRSWRRQQAPPDARGK
ncbi:MAG: DUF2274 domain-containing protein [Myxococcota bacterium]|nr:DUF2274 domain-containing protein [Myxococcota bacterium]